MASTSDKAAAALAVAQRISAALKGIPAARMPALDATAAGAVSADSSAPNPTAVPAPSASAAAPTAALSALQRAAQAAARLQGINQQGADHAAARTAAAAAAATAPPVEYPFREIDINQCVDRSALTLRATHDNVRIATATENFCVFRIFLRVEILTHSCTFGRVCLRPPRYFKRLAPW
jgi:hypothetical protein